VEWCAATNVGYSPSSTCALNGRTNRRSLGTSKKATLLRKSESTRQKSASVTNSKECSGRSTTDTTDTPDKSGKTVVTPVVSAGAQWQLRHHLQRCTTFRRFKTSANFCFRKFRVNLIAYYQLNTESHFVHNCSAFRASTRCRGGLRSSGMLGGVGRSVVTNISGTPSSKVKQSKNNRHSTHNNVYLE